MSAVLADRALLSVSTPWYANAWIRLPGGAGLAGLVGLALIAPILYVRKRREAERLLEEEYRARRAAEKLRAEIQAKNAQLLEAKKAADSANRAKSVFLANMSHELRAALTAIIGFSEMLVSHIGSSSLVAGCEWAGLPPRQRDDDFLAKGRQVEKAEKDGGHKHPRQVILDRYDELSPKPVVFQTNKYLQGAPGGNVPDEFIGDLDPDDDDGTLTLTAVPSVGQFFVSYGTNLHTFNIKPRDGSPIVIASLLPRPAGSDSQNEQVTLRNRGTIPIDVTTWYLGDASGKTWSLTAVGTITAGASVTVTRRTGWRCR